MPAHVVFFARKESAFADDVEANLASFVAKRCLVILFMQCNHRPWVYLGVSVLRLPFQGWFKRNPKRYHLLLLFCFFVGLF